MPGSVIVSVRRFFGSPAGRWLAIALTIAAVIRIYWFIGSANHSGPWPVYMDYYDQQAEGFRNGHLYVPVTPHPDLLAKADPYDPAHLHLWYFDVSFYKGRYYMYWGPVPALLQALAKTALRIKGIIGDQYLVFAMFSLMTTAGALIIERLQRRVFPTIPLWALLLAILAFGLANPAPHLVASGGVYQASIAAAQAFLLTGFVFAFDAVWEAQTSQPKIYRFVLAGIAWALALGSRVSMAPTIAVLGALTACAAALGNQVRSAGFWRQSLKGLLWIGLPVGTAFAMLLIYNKLRFESFFEFGTNVQLSTLKFRVSTDYLLVNAYTYLLRPFKAACEFPYAFSLWNPTARASLPKGMTVPAGYMITEPVVGWLRIVIVTWWIPITAFFSFRTLRGLLKARDPRGRSASDIVYVYCTAVFAVLSTLTGLVLMGMYLATMRYLSDVTSGLVLLGISGAFMLCHRLGTRLPRTLALTATGGTLLGTIFFGLLLGYQGYSGHIKRFNPEFDARMQKYFSVCRDK